MRKAAVVGARRGGEVGRRVLLSHPGRSSMWRGVLVVGSEGGRSVARACRKRRSVWRALGLHWSGVVEHVQAGGWRRAAASRRGAVVDSSSKELAVVGRVGDRGAVLKAVGVAVVVGVVDRRRSPLRPTLPLFLLSSLFLFSFMIQIC